MRGAIAIISLAMFVAACDTVRPDEPGTLVVEAYVESGEPLPAIRIARTQPVADTSAAPVSGAGVLFSLNGVEITYLESDVPGRYLPEPRHAGTIAEPGDRFHVAVDAGPDRADADGTLPPRLTDVDIGVVVAEHPVQAVLLDSLSLPLDSLQLELPSRTGLVYPVVAAIDWGGADPDSWVSLKVEPRVPFSSTLLDYFLRPSAVARESDLAGPTPGSGSWSGVYAVPVDDEDAPVPPHDLIVTVIRGDATWAAYAASAGDPPRREPVSNVVGGIGIVAGISVVRRTVPVP